MTITERTSASVVERLRDGLFAAYKMKRGKRWWPELAEDRKAIVRLTRSPQLLETIAAAFTQGESRQAGWVEWHGGENPVGHHDVVEAKRRDGSVITKAAFKFDWGHGPIAHGSDIIAYRVVTPAAPTPADGGGE
jgi:hypothetical protein